MGKPFGETIRESVPEFLRVAKALELTAEDFTVLTEQVKRRRPSETGVIGQE